MKPIRYIFALAIIVAALALPTTASAQVADNYTGWGTVAPASGSYWAPAYKWYTGYGWSSSWRYAKASVYIQPYAAGWSWTWDSVRGWLAMRTSDLSAPAAQAQGRIYGHITVGPTCPVVREGVTCERDGAGITLTLKGTAGSFAFTADATGSFSGSLPAGTYSVATPAGYLGISPATVTINAYRMGVLVMLTQFHVETGIR